MVNGALLVPTWMIMLSGFFLRCGTTKNFISWIVAPGKVLNFINLLCDIFDSSRPDNIESSTVRVVPFFHAGSVLLLSSNNTSHLFSVSFDAKVSDILKTSWYVACIFFTFSIRFFIWIITKSIWLSLLCSLLLLLLLLSFLLLLLCITLLFLPYICLMLSKLLLLFILHVSLLNWGSTLKSIIGSLLLSIKASLHGCLKLSCNVDALFNSSNISVMLSFKSLLFSLKHGPCCRKQFRCQLY